MMMMMVVVVPPTFFIKAVVSVVKVTSEVWKTISVGMIHVVIQRVPVVFVEPVPVAFVKVPGIILAFLARYARTGHFSIPVAVTHGWSIVPTRPAFPLLEQLSEVL